MIWELLDLFPLVAITKNEVELDKANEKNKGTHWVQHQTELTQTDPTTPKLSKFRG